MYDMHCINSGNMVDFTKLVASDSIYLPIVVNTVSV